MQQFIYDSSYRHASFDSRLAHLLGGKAASLAIMSGKLGLPVPPAMTVSIEGFHRWRNSGSVDFLEPELQAGIARMQTKLERVFGGTLRPLVVSVRSGAPVSMPGMMDTILDLGLNEETAAGLALELGNEAGANALARFRTSYQHIVGSPPPHDVWQQLLQAIIAVFASWDSPRAKTYRARAGLSDDLGTAATIQAMAFGTAPGFSGTGVAFTRDPSTGDPHPMGDWLANAQGEDVVAGTHATEPLAVLAAAAPDLWQELRQAFVALEDHFADMCDVEFTIESGKLWILQARAGKRSPLAAIRIAVERAESARFAFTRADALRAISLDDLRAVLAERNAAASAVCLTTGLGASPGIATGKACFDADTAMDMAASGDAVILIRPETSPEDIHGMDVAVGVLTATGGLVSHAAIVAREWRKPAVVGASEISVGVASATIGTREITAGDIVTIDGSSGQVFAGTIDSDAAVLDPAVQRFIDWTTDAAGGTADPLEALAAIKSIAVQQKNDEGA